MTKTAEKLYPGAAQGVPLRKKDTSTAVVITKGYTVTVFCATIFCKSKKSKERGIILKSCVKIRHNT